MREHPRQQHPLPPSLYRAEQVKALDRAAIEQGALTGYTLMNRAGEAALLALRLRFPAARRLLVVCGGGNNGGDGYVIARLAKASGLAVQVVAASDPATLQGDAATAFQAAKASDVAIVAAADGELPAADLIVDALLGIGASRPVEGLYGRLIAAINRHPAPAFAVDVPSGVEADTGALLGEAVRAAYTLCFIGLKRGLFTGAAPEYTGTVAFAGLTVPAAIYQQQAPAARLELGEELAHWLGPRPRTAHKGQLGHALIVGGDSGYSGAARLSAEAAGRCGAGLVSVATRALHAPLQAAIKPDIMFRGVESPQALAPLLERASVVALGPGLGQGEWGERLWAAAIAFPGPLVVDADGLNWLAQRPHFREDWVLTPHPGEAGRLLGCDAATVERDRFAAAAGLAERYGGVVVLKGAGTLIATASECWVCPLGNPGMAVAGMGDILTGVITALRAQGLDAIAAARLGVLLHAKAGDRAAADGERGMMASDLLPVLRQLCNSSLEEVP